MATQTRPYSRQETLAALAERMRRIEVRKRPVAAGIVSSGLAAFDRLLPERGFRRGTLVEWLATCSSGAGSLALVAARQIAATGGAVVVVDRQGRFYPPAAAGLGIDLSQLIIVRPCNEADEAWALDQILRSPGVAAVWGWPGEHDDHTQRRWQLAAEATGAVGLLIRPPQARQEPSWAELRLGVEPIEDTSASSRYRRLRVELLRTRTGRAGGTIELKLVTTHDSQPLERNHVEPTKRQARAVRA